MKALLRIAKIALALFLLIWIFKTNNLNLEQLKSNDISWNYLLLALLIPTIINPIIATNRWRSFLLELNIKESFLTLLKIQLKSQFIGLALPSTQGQDAVRMMMIGKKNPNKSGAAASTVIIERLWGFSLYLLFALVATILAKTLPERNKILLIIGSISLLLAFAFFILINQKILNKLQKIMPKFKIMNKVFKTLDEIQISITNFPVKKVFWKTSALIFLFQFLTIVCVALTFESLGTNTPFKAHLVFYPIIAIISILPITFGGFGIREGFFAYFYPLVGVAKDTSILASLLVYGLLILSPAIIGGVFFIYDNLTQKKHD